MEEGWIYKPHIERVKWDHVSECSLDSPKIIYILLSKLCTEWLYISIEYVIYYILIFIMMVYEVFRC